MGHRGGGVWINGMRLPIDPPGISYRLPTDNRQYEIIGLGDVNLLRAAKLAEITFEGILPPHTIPGVNTGHQQPSSYIGMWQAIIDAKTPVGFVYVGEQWSIALTASLEGLDFSEKGGAVGWVEYSLRLLKYTPYTARRASASGITAPVRTSEAPEAPAAPETVAVKASSSKKKNAGKAANEITKHEVENPVAQGAAAASGVKYSVPITAQASSGGGGSVKINRTMM